MLDKFLFVCTDNTCILITDLINYIKVSFFRLFMLVKMLMDIVPLKKANSADSDQMFQGVHCMQMSNVRGSRHQWVLKCIFFNVLTKIDFA